MNLRISVTPRWSGLVPTGRNEKNLPSNQWARAGRKRKWLVRWFAPDGSRPGKTFNARELADAFARDKVAEFEAGGSLARVQPQRRTLGAFVAEVLELRTGPKGQRLSASTVREYKTILNRFATFIGSDVPLDRLSMSDATHYFADIQATPSVRTKRPLSASSVNKHRRIIKSAFNVAVMQLDYLRVNPFGRLKQDKVAQKDIRVVSPAEYLAIAAECRAMPEPLWWETFLAVCYTSGTRLHEATHLTWGDIDFDAGTIRVSAKPELGGLEAWQPKDRDARTIPVPAQTIDLLTRLHADAEAGSVFVFLAPERVEWIRARREAGKWREGQPVLNNVTNNFQRRASKAGVLKVTIHDLRRSAITCWARDIPVHVVRELAGHADIATTMFYYAKVCPADLARAREVCASALAL